MESQNSFYIFFLKTSRVQYILYQPKMIQKQITTLYQMNLRKKSKQILIFNLQNPSSSLLIKIKKQKTEMQNQKQIQSPVTN